MDPIFRRLAPIGMKRRYSPFIVAHFTLQEVMKPLFERAKKEGLFFRNRHSGAKFTFKELSTLMKAGFLAQGPTHWHLIDAQGRRVA